MTKVELNIGAMRRCEVIPGEYEEKVCRAECHLRLFAILGSVLSYKLNVTALGRARTVL